MVVLDSNVYTAVDTLTNTEVAEHLRTLRTEHVQRLIRPLLQRLLLHPKNIGNLFNKPVDPVLLELPDYFIRIKKPMDLGTVKSRLQGGYYDSIDKATSDISLVFKNALIYNAPSHDIHLIAKMMKADFDADLLALKERRARETERKNTHRCDPCLGSSCPLCLEKCMKFDPPVLVCHGTCLQRVKKNSVYYVTVDGIMLWCQRCYTGLPSLILELTGRPPLLKKNLLKRRLDEEVAEPWVKCDKCDRPCHQICALYNNRISTTSSSNRADVDKDIAAPNGVGRIGEGVNGMSTPCTSSSSQDRYECPLCKQESLQQLDFKRTEASDVVRSQDSDIPSLPTTPAFTPLEKKKGVHYSEAVCELDETTSDSEMGECEGGLNAVKLQKQNNRLPTPVFVRAETRSRAGAAKVMSDTKVKSAMKAAQSPKQRLSRTSADAVPHAATAINTATSSQSVSTPIALSSTTPKKSDLIILAKGSALVEKEDIMDVTEDDNLVNDTPRLDPTTAPHPNGGEGSVMGKRNRGSDSDSAARVEPPAELPAHLIQWRASTLPRSRLGDFLEAMVAERLRSSGFEAAADTVTVRMTSNVEQYMELPLIITDNLRTSEGLCVPPYLGYRQKCILLFQRVDGVDICLFCLYVQEFGESCPEPNKSVVYIAYLDSVDFFR